MRVKQTKKNTQKAIIVTHKFWKLAVTLHLVLQHVKKVIS